MRARLGSGEVTLRRWREQDAPELQRVVQESMAHLRPWMAWVGPGELGYWLHPGHVGRGAATRAASLLAAEAFRVGAKRVEIVTDVANTRSAAIPERLGFAVVDRRPPQEPVTPGEDGLDLVWRLTPDQGRSGEDQGSS